VLDALCVNAAVKQIVKLGQGALMAKIDVKHAYRNVPVHPEDRSLLGMEWDGKVFLDKTLPFGLRSAPKIFCALADALEWILEAAGVEWSIHYIDDFFTVGPPHSESCQGHLSRIVETCRELGIPLKREKVEGPTCTITFLPAQ